jgi:threonine synthase
LIKLVKESKINATDTTVVISTGNGLKDQSSILNRVNDVPLITTEKLIADVFNKCNDNELEKVFKILKTNEVMKDD